MSEHTSPEEIQEVNLPENTEEPKEKPGFAADCYGWLQALTFALLILIVVFTFFGRIIGVDGSSMVPTLEHGDMLLLQCVGYEPEQGDVVVVHKDFASITGPIVKRVIATGGQTVEINYNLGLVTVDGEVIHEPYINEPMERPDSQWETIDSVTVP